MFGLSNLYFFLIIWILIIHIENIYYFIYKKLLTLTVKNTQRVLLTTNTLYTLNISPVINCFLYFLTISTTKLEFCTLNSINVLMFGQLLIVMYFFCVLAYSFLLKNAFQLNHFLPLTISSLFFFTFFLLFINDFLVFLFFLEVIAVYYYFFFLRTVEYGNLLSAVAYKNCILFYLWNSFFTSLIFGGGLVVLGLNIGTLTFLEITFFAINTYWISITLLIVAVSWKLGLPGVHFFKMQLYLYLDEISIFFFTILSTLINILIFLFLIFQAPVLIYLNTYSFLVVVLFLFFNVAIVNKIESLQMFLAVSSVITLFICTLILIF